MVRIIAELSINTPTASSGDRYKYRYGCGGGSGYNERQQIIYKRTAHALVEKEKEKQPMLVNGDNGYQSNVIRNHVDAINEQTEHINTMIATHRDMREKQQIREKCGNSEKENLKKEEEVQGVQGVQGVQVINPKLGKISYRSRTGELFFAQHSVHLTTIFVFDKTTGESIQSQTQKVVWNNKVFETKQKWFSEMARLCVDSAEEKMKIVSCE